MEGQKNSFGWRLANLAIAGFLVAAYFDIVTGLEHWPFGSYPMYSLLYPEQLSWLRLYGVTNRGEILLRGERDFAPFDDARLTVALERLARAREGSQQLDQALRSLMRLHDLQEARRSPAGKPLRGLRLYAVRWVLRPGLEGSGSPDERTLVAEVTADVATDEAGR